MTIVLLAYASFVALLVTSHPIVLHSDADLVAASSALQAGIQAPFGIHTSKDDLASDASRFHFKKPEQEIEYLGEDVTTIASFHVPGEPPLFEAVLGDTVEKNALDAVGDVTTLEPTPTDESPSAPLVVLAFSCIAAFLALACVALTLYVIRSLRSRVLASKNAWELLPHFWRRPKSETDSAATAKRHLLGGGSLLLQPERFLNAEEGSAQRNESQPGGKPLYFDIVSDMESEWDDVDEKYQDALDMTPIAHLHDLPLEDNVSRPSHAVDPPLLLTTPRPFDKQTAHNLSTPPMRELCLSPVARPAWSVRAMDSPALGLSSRHGSVDATPEPLIHPHRRAYRSPVPELDIALAMQLRPGLGIGADSAWMVRFLMAIFGWFAVALTGNAR